MTEPNCKSCLDAQNIKPGIINEIRYKQAIDKLKAELDTVTIERDELLKACKSVAETANKKPTYYSDYPEIGLRREISNDAFLMSVKAMTFTLTNVAIAKVEGRR